MSDHQEFPSGAALNACLKDLPSGAALSTCLKDLPVGADVSDYLKVAISLGEEELLALKEGDVERAETCFQRRTACMELAMAFKDSHPGELREGLLTLQDLQAELIREGRVLRAALATELNKSKAQSRRLQGYKLAVSQAKQ